MNRAAARFGWTALLVGWAVDLLFWQKAPGISFPMWIAITLAAGLLLARSMKVKPAPLSLALVAAALLFSGMTFVRRESFTLFISTLLSFFSLALLAATFQTGNWWYYKLADIIKAGLQLLLALLIRPFDLFMRKPQDKPSIPPAPPAEGEPGAGAAAPLLVAAGPAWKSTVRSQAMPIARGLLLALPVVLILGMLLASADPVFNNWTRDLLKIFDLSKLSEYLFRLFYILVIAFMLAGSYLHAIQPAALEARPKPDARWFAPFLGWTEAVVVLVSVNLLFVVFVSIQFWYLFGGQANISTTGFTFSEYARRGFNELVFVALLSLGLYLGLGAVARQETILRRNVLTALNILLIAQVLVILVSSYSRLLLYEDAYGFTALRTYTHIFILWLGLLLAVTIGLEIARRRPVFALVALLVSFGFGLTFGLLNVDSFIASQNIQRAWTHDGQLDGQYLTGLSDDAVPTLLAEYQRSNQPAAVKDILGAELSCRKARVDQNPLPTSWLSTNLSQTNAFNLLQANQALWKDYPTNNTGGVKLPNGSIHKCQANLSID